MLVDAGADSLQLQRQSTFKQEAYPPHAPVIATRRRRQRFVSFPGPAVQSDLNREGRKLAQVVGDLLVDKNAVRKQRDQEALLLCVGVDLEKIFAGKDFAAG